jgi:L-cysteine:1D-myo-inositol 2-amino-2-deoxy-alpha-D-glucopyranoside ligase
MIDQLITEGLAYESAGNVYFEVSKDPEFGKLSHLPRENMLEIANERGNTPDDPNKRNPLDFVLWQAAKPGEPTWDSPWSAGRPGWHIECSAMATRYLGPSIDIHGGGLDLVFPHHESEIAQTENATGVEPFARCWVHVGMVEYQGEKMSKSLGNLVLISEALNDHSADAIRLYLFSHHYRSAWEFKDEELEEWATVAEELVEAVEFPSFGVTEQLDVSVYRDQFLNALDDDLDTPAATQSLRDIGQAILEAHEDDDLTEAQATLRELSSILGLELASA